ncbi:Myotubularin-related phosphatidylinositol 3-phosphate 3-phosphatase MTM6 [Ceraceosorus bombacis]|uniref:Myotubularin-related phosphatidylinositol 3-phosphate 3-phosphatase MTM6 n=1 Tax=Ceraceosorus bombacis TaxID=401625 RepID=A0A0P1BAL9_9BASI|nr:Myotubularin-related phosphatidylinositol 3-phosphate 3-phosphatase MTM6 [Ceraceosorus bombacis]
MDQLKVTKVEGVLLQEGNECRKGTLHLTQHHLIWVTPTPSRVASPIASSSALTLSRIKADQQEIWLPYSLFWLLTPDPRRAYAFYRVPADTTAQSEAQSRRGWAVYDFKKEFARQGVGTRTKAWRYCDINAGYAFSPSYPSMMVVPSRISDSTLRYASKYRSKARIPALSYLHWANFGSITRSSQPMVGLNNRSLQDEKLIEAIFTTHLFADPMSPAAQAAAAASAQAGGNGAPANVALIYGAQTTNLIVDARPTANAVANRAKGAGTENMEHYRGCKKAYLGVENIHVMRDSLSRLTDALRQTDAPATFGMRPVAAETTTTDITDIGEEGRGPAVASVPSVVLQQRRSEKPLDYTALKKSGWLKHTSALLEGTLLIARIVHVNSSHVLIHCSDGWDRTSQLSALAQVCLDPYYRTLEGFAVLVEKDWCSFGHRFWDRCGHASSPKYFNTASGYGEESDEEEDTSDGEAASGFEAQSQAAANAIWGFTKSLATNFQGGGPSGGPSGAHLKEISPVFLQFLDCVWQMQRQFPQRFEFNEEFLVELQTQLHECRFGTFLSNCEQESRRPVTDDIHAARPFCDVTASVWDALLSSQHRERYTNPAFDASLNDPKRESADMGVLLPVSKDVRYFARMFRRGDEEMNAGIVAEIEEQRRQVEALENARKAAIAAAEAGPSEASRSSIAAVTSGSDRTDPGSSGLSNGIVSPSSAQGVERVEAPLAYKPRVPKARGINTSNHTAMSPSQASLHQHLSAVEQPPLDDRILDSAGTGAADAAARMRGLFVSGWGRLQAAYADSSPAHAAETPSEAPRYGNGEVDLARGAYHPPSMTDSLSSNAGISKPPSNRQSSGESLQARLANLTEARRTPPQPTTPKVKPNIHGTYDANPWAASTERQGLQDELGDVMRNEMRGSPSRPSLASSAQRTRSTASKSSDSQQGKTAADPLGVGF